MGVANVLQKSSYLGDKGMLSGLSESDKIAFAKADTRNIEILPLFVSYAKKMSDALEPEPVDVFLLATLLSEARRLERQYKLGQAIKAIERLSPLGRKSAMAAVEQEISTISYQILDFSGLAVYLPGQVISVAHIFISGVHREQNNRSTNNMLDQNISTKGWSVILKWLEI